MSTKKFNLNAIELLTEITQQRNWHKGKIDRAYAAFVKKKLQSGEGGVSYKKACEILETIGYHKVKEETWKEPR